MKNDVLVDGCKVCGFCITRYGKIDFSSGIISMNVNLDHIKAICKKPMEKVPKGLSEYGITTEEVEKMFIAFCEQQSKQKFKMKAKNTNKVNSISSSPLIANEQDTMQDVAHRSL